MQLTKDIKQYKAVFQADFGGIDKSILWVESHLAKTLRVRSFEEIIIDKIGLVMFESVSNIVEHSITHMSKINVYNKKINYIQSLRQRQQFCCFLEVGTRQIRIKILYPFKPHFTFDLREKNVLGGRGEHIIKAMGVKVRRSVDYVKKTAVLTLYMPYV
ncbi:hypothetical protein OQH61_01130 [Helicobacter sp. MIT 21-1697]|uniref:hypothetical protein n=1 Tax=Helicobacter sp. MIT 21-1697 TaxID=2993733 RepID=UPI00224A509F|nr:hypothetical protein [Helicobacter sp. MIT 21-1697]MCX2716343.1 hypothetical protein [Helicobacter sp. MIT 21-1697]